MKAVLRERVGQPLRSAVAADPQAVPGQLLLQALACGVCRTDLHVVDGELPEPKLPLIPSHQIVGRVLTAGDRMTAGLVGRRVGVPWLGHTCGCYEACRREEENLCEEALFAGYQLDGGYGELVAAEKRFCFPIPEGYDDTQAAPPLCGGLIGYRALRMAGDGERLGFYGFGSAAHMLLQVARFQGRRVFASTRPGDRRGQEFARGLGAEWAGGSDEAPPVLLDAALLFAPVGAANP